MEPKESTFWKILVFAFPLAIVIALGFIPFIGAYLCPGLELFSKAILNGDATKVSESDAKALLTLLEHGVVISPERLITEIVSFYTTMLQILMAILSVLGIVAFFSLRAVSKDQAERVADKAVIQHFDKKAFHDNVENFIRRSMEPDLEKIHNHFQEIEASKLKMDDLEALTEHFESLKYSYREMDRQIKILSEAISNLDSSESDVQGRIDLGV